MNQFIILGMGAIAVGVFLWLTAVKSYQKKLQENKLSNWSKYEYFRLRLFIFSCIFGGVISLLVGIFEY